MFDTKLGVLLTLYITAIFMSNLLGLKTLPFLFGTHISFAVFTIPIVFITTDIVGKVYGEKTAKTFVYLGFFALFLWSIASIAAGMLPWASDTFARIGGAYESIFTLSIRVGLASLIAFFISEYIDVRVFMRYKNKKHTFFLASTLSNIVSQFLDTALFMTIAFVGVFSPQTILMMAIPWWVYKFSMGVAYMPISYFLLTHFFKHDTQLTDRGSV